MNNILSYEDFLLSKIKVADKAGIKVDESRLHPDSKPHQKAIALWALELGRALIAPDCGTGKTNISLDVLTILQQEFGGKCLVVTELGAHDTYCSTDPEVGEGTRMCIPVMFERTTEELLELSCNIVCTNYESVRLGKIDFSAFTAVWLDEGNYIKNMASETTDALAFQLKKVKWKFIASATPSPNEVLELVNYAHVLGICDRGQILTRFFQRNSTKAGDLTLHPQHEADFWLWVHTWMVAIEKPSDLGFSDEGYDLPELNIHWIEVKLNEPIAAGIEKNGQMRLVADTGGNDLPTNAKIKQASIDVRLQKALEIINEFPEKHFVIWHHLNTERDAITKALKNNNYAYLTGSQPEETKENIIVDFTKGNLQYLATKPEISGVGCNFQKHCHKSIDLGVNNDFNLLYQRIKRIHRFGQSYPVDHYILYLPEEYAVVQNLKRKYEQHIKQRNWLRNIVKTYGLDHSKMIEERRRTFKVNRKVYKGENYKLISTDATFEWRDHIQDNFFGLINSSFPFGNHYEYTSYYNDFGHNASNNDFRKQLNYLLPELLRSLQPGRICAVHLKNRIHYGSVTGKGFSVFHRFTHLVCDAMEEHGFETMGFHYIPTDVVAENNQTYRLTFGEMQKDSTKMGAGIPEEIWLFRKPPTTTDNAYADEPVQHNCECPLCHNYNPYENFVNSGSNLLKCPHKDCRQLFPEEDLIRHSDYQLSLAHWQVDADGYWMSSQNTLYTPGEMKKWEISRIRNWWNFFTKEHIYDYKQHVELLRELDNIGKLSKTWTTLPFQSNTDWIWSNVNRMHGLNLEQSRRKERNHICPQPYDEVDRIIELYSNPGDMVGDPFGGLCTTGRQAILKGRKAYLTELNDEYARCGNIYLKLAETKKKTPLLFDELKAEAPI